MLSQAANVTTA